jgi:acyl-CoA thioesterase-2
MIMQLDDFGGDHFAARGPATPWGLYGGQIVAQALCAASSTVEGADLVPNSVRASFISRGDSSADVSYRVERNRDGRSISNRHVRAEQDGATVLTADCTFHRGERGALVAQPMPLVDGPHTVADSGWAEGIERRELVATYGAFHAWVRVSADLLGAAPSPILQRCWLAYVSDDFPADVVVGAHPDNDGSPAWIESSFIASLDHSIWFHDTPSMSEWTLFSLTCQRVAEGRGLAIGQVFTERGQHVASLAQELLIRRSRAPIAAE